MEDFIYLKERGSLLIMNRKILKSVTGKVVSCLIVEAFDPTETILKYDKVLYKLERNSKRHWVVKHVSRMGIYTNTLEEITKEEYEEEKKKIMITYDFTEHVFWKKK